MLSLQWQTEVLPIPTGMQAPFMSCVRLPDEFETILGTHIKARHFIRKHLYGRYKIALAIVCIQSSLWCRVAVSVYNSKENYVKLANAVKTMRDELKLGVLSFEDIIKEI